MSFLTELYRPSLTLLADLYQLTMAYGYWKAGLTERRAAFQLVFRQHPFGGGFTIAAGLESAVSFLQEFRFRDEDLEYLSSLTGSDGTALFSSGFLDYLRDLRFTGDVDAIPEGAVVFPREPLLRVTGPILQCQLVETPLLNFFNFQSLVATKAARVCLAAGEAPVLEFGLRRAQGVDGGLAASRSAYIGGCAATSNVLAGRLFGIPVKGTMAHSWVMAFDDETEAFATYANAMPNNTILLVDTYNTLEGVRRACAIGHQLRQRGFRLAGVRIDSGDLAALSRRAREILDAEGLRDAIIVASSDLDEYKILELRRRGAKVNAWGVGTRLVTAYDQPALGGVYKLCAIQGPTGEWKYRVKVSDDLVKSTLPGIHQVRRFMVRGEFAGDVIYEAGHDIDPSERIVDLNNPSQPLAFPDRAPWEDLLQPVFRRGKLVVELPDLESIRRRAAQQLECLPPGLKRLDSPPDPYPVGLTHSLSELKRSLVAAPRAPS